MTKTSKAQLRAQTKYQSSPEQIKKREARNRARYQMIKHGKAHKGDGKDVAHKDGHALHNTPGNWELQSKHKNRSYPRTKNARKKYAGS